MPNYPAKKPMILIVDDESSVRELLLELLSERYVCDSSANTDSALNKLANHDFAVVISDIDMPGASGLELASRARSIAPNASVVLTSGNVLAEYAEKASAAGAFKFIEKPFDLANVESVVAEAVNRHRERTAKKFDEAEMDRMLERPARRASMRDYQAFGNSQATVAKCH